MHFKLQDKSKATRNFLLILLLLLLPLNELFSQNHIQTYKPGEFLKFRLQYGILNAGYATLQVDKTDNENIYKLYGHGCSVGMFKWFFKVEDTYQSFIRVQDGLPIKMKRDVSEGGYEINRVINFDRNNNTVSVIDKKKPVKSDSIYSVPENILDMLSAFYHARDYNTDTLKLGQSYKFDVFLDFDVFKFELLYQGKEMIKTEWGRIECLKFKPVLLTGRVFEEDEGVTLWVSNDKNKIPIRFQSKLRVGTIKVELDEFKGLKHSFRIFHN